jgi:hypothetical protein
MVISEKSVVKEIGGAGEKRTLNNSLARPGGNATGFIQFEYGISGKWLELLKADRAGRGARGSYS